MSNPNMARRGFMASSTAALAGAGFLPGVLANAAQAAMPTDRHIYKCLKFGMFREKLPVIEAFEVLREAGFDGVEINSPSNLDLKEVVAASRKLKFPVCGVIDSIHWKIRLSDPDPAVRAEGVKGLKGALRDAKTVGASTVLLVPGRVNEDKNETHDQVWRRSIEGIRQVIPLASWLGVRIGIENVWNGFCYDPKQLADYLDEIDSPWVGSYFDIGNHVKYGKPQDWIRTLGSRIVKLDVKDWGGPDQKFTTIGDGDVNWPKVREALQEIGYRGWASAEVKGGDRERMAEVAANMDKNLLGL
jgi:hexulose-6-phosphate isomerase